MAGHPGGRVPVENDPVRTFIESTLGYTTGQGQPMPEPDWACSAT
jgi:hypothetical protein